MAVALVGKDIPSPSTLKRKVISIWEASKLGYTVVDLPPFQLERPIPPPHASFALPSNGGFETSHAPEPAAIRFENCLLLPDGSVVTDDHYIFHGLTFVPVLSTWTRYAPFVESVANDIATIRCPDSTCDVSIDSFQLVTGHGQNYGHFHHDVLARIYFSTLIPQISSMKFICRNPLYPLQNFLLKNLLGEKNLHFQNRESIKVKSCVVTALPSGPDGVLLEAIEFERQMLRERIPERTPSKGRRRIYISRADGQKTHGRDLVNEGEVQALLTSCGFEILVLSKLSPEEQITAFRQAECVVAVHGAGLMNLMFCPPSTNIVEFQVPNATPPWIVRIGNLLGHKHFVLPLARHGNDSAVILADLQKVLSAIIS